VQTKIFDLEERMRALEAVLARTEIRSPAGGTVVGLGMYTVGGVIAAGNPILDIVPEDTHLVVEAQVQPTNSCATRSCCRACRRK
jgi:multidrug resistance efflux pump